MSALCKNSPPQPWQLRLEPASSSMPSGPPGTPLPSSAARGSLPEPPRGLSRCPPRHAPRVLVATRCWTSLGPEEDGSLSAQCAGSGCSVEAEGTRCPASPVPPAGPSSSEGCGCPAAAESWWSQLRSRAPQAGSRQDPTADLRQALS